MTAPTVSGAVPYALLIRSRTRSPPSDTCTICRRVMSRRPLAAVVPPGAIAALQVPVQLPLCGASARMSTAAADSRAINTAMPEQPARTSRERMQAFLSALSVPADAGRPAFIMMVDAAIAYATPRVHKGS